MSKPKNPLRLNVGFITQQPVGYSREFLFDFPTLSLSPDLELNAFSGQARVSRIPQGLVVQAHLEAYTPVECVRCLTLFPQPLETNFTELFAFSPRNASESDLLLPENGYLDLAPLAREFLLLEIPISPLCNPDCSGLCPICGESRADDKCHHDFQEIDPRLAALQALLDE